MHVDPAGRTIKQVLIFDISDCHAARTRRVSEDGNAVVVCE